MRFADAQGHREGERSKLIGERRGTGAVNRSDVLRLALAKGLSVLERQYRQSS